MEEHGYAVVAYLPGKLGDFVDSLRKRLNPSFADWLAHVTVLPSRSLRASPEETLERIRERCALVEPFVATIQGVSTFWPVNGVVYLSFSLGFQHLVQLHDTLNVGGLAQEEAYSYLPHVTVAQELDEAGTQAVLADVSREWSRFSGDVSFRVESLRLVRQAPENRWVDLAPIPLGSFLAPSRK